MHSQTLQVTLRCLLQGEKNVVLISLEEWNALQKAARNGEYLGQLDRSFEQLRSGCGRPHELIEVDDE